MWLQRGSMAMIHKPILSLIYLELVEHIKKASPTMVLLLTNTGKYYKL